MNITLKLRNSLERAIKGYDSSSVINFSDWFLTTIPKMLEEMADKNKYSYPPEFKDLDEWNKQIRKISALLKESDEANCSMTNEYWEDYWYRAFTLNQKATLDNEKWILRENEIDEYRKKCFHKAMELLEKYFYYLWM